MNMFFHIQSPNGSPQLCNKVVAHSCKVSLVGGEEIVGGPTLFSFPRSQ